MTSTTDNSRQSPLLGCIADDVTGATDLATNLVQAGMRVVQILDLSSLGPERSENPFVDVDAVVIALKTRSIDATEAIQQSLRALKLLQNSGIQRFYFKYCSTFDSTTKGNIGPVAEALMDALEVSQTIFCPAFPQAGRTVYQGHLFVNDKLLHESGMEHHPVNPMTDSNLMRVLGAQSNRKVGHLPVAGYSKGPRFVTEELSRLQNDKKALVVADACDETHLMTLAQAVADMPLLTGGSALARYLPGPYRDAQLLKESPPKQSPPKRHGRSLIVAGSCSLATNAQVAWMRDKCPVWEVDVPAVMNDSAAEQQKVKLWAHAAIEQQPLLIASTATADSVAELQKQFGAAAVASAVEQFLAEVTDTLTKELLIGQLITAGGETSGAVVQKLGIQALRIGPEICTGVPWTEAVRKGSPSSPSLSLALKSGNFGSEDFFEAALEMLA